MKRRDHQSYHLINQWLQDGDDGHWFPISRNDTNGLTTPAYFVHHVIVHFIDKYIFISFTNVPMIAMTTQIPVIMSLTISIAVYVKTITHSSHSLKLEFMMAASWSLTGFVFVIPCMTATGAAGDHRLLYHFRKCCTFKKQTIILFSSFGFTFITPPPPPYTYEFPYPTWVHIQLRWFNAEETQLHG